MSIPYCFPARGDGNRYCIAAPADPGRTLCGRRVESAPVVPPPFPRDRCPKCVRCWFGEPHPVPVVMPEFGTCPACVGEAPLDEAGRMVPHGQWRATADGGVWSSRSCTGAGELPEAGS